MAATMNSSSTMNFSWISTWVRRSSSSIEITEVIDVVLSRPLMLLPSVGMISRMACGLILVSALWAAHRSNVLAIERQKDVVVRAVAVERGELLHEQATVARWDDA